MGVHLVDSKAREELIRRIQALGPTEPKFRVATRIGFHKSEFVLPDRVIAAGPSNIGVCLDQSSAPYAGKFRVSNDKNWSGIPKLAKGNSRFMACLALGFVGPCVIVMDLEQVGLQLAGPPESGKSSIAIATGSIWGRHVDPNRAREHGFMETWNNTLAKFEPMALGHNHSILIADETRTASGEKSLAAGILEIVMHLEKAAEKGRQPDPMAPRSWWVPFLSTSNKSLDELCRAAGIELDDAYRGRLIDIGPPEGGSGFFENLHGYPDVVAFSVRIKELAATCFGGPSRRFIRKLVRWHAKDPKGLRSWFERQRRIYLKYAEKILAPGRQLNRIHQKLATLYAAGCLAIKFDILPWRMKALGKALLKCERDHVTLVATHSRNSVGAAQDPFKQLLLHIRTNQHKFVDLTNPDSGQVAGDQDGNLGYLNVWKGKREFLFTEDCFQEIVGGKAPAVALKPDLDRRGLIVKTGAGKQSQKYVTRRHLVNAQGKKERHWVVAIDARILDVEEGK